MRTHQRPFRRILIICGSLCGSLLLGVAAGCRTASAAPDPAALNPAMPAGAAKGLAYTLSDKGLTTLSYNGQSLFGYAWNGDLGGPTYRVPQLLKADGSPAIDKDDKAALAALQTVTRALDTTAQKVTLTYSWGIVSCQYAQQGDRLTMKLSLTNTSQTNTIAPLDLQSVEFVFPSVPQGRTLDGGMWGNGGMHQLSAFPMPANPRHMPPVIMVDYGTASLAFCNEEVKDVPGGTIVEVPWTTNHPLDTMYPFWVSFPALKPGQSANATVSLRFGPEGASATTLAGDVLARYAKAYPFQLKWKDHRPIGALFLATSEQHPETNPRGWLMNAKDVDTTTPEGRAAWRERLLKYADGAIQTLKDINAQGMVTWDPEGQEFVQATYYGDPRLADILAPETMEKGPSGLAVIDEYFKKFRDAGLRVGICIRPQQIKMVDGKPVQQESADVTQTLKDKIAYAKKRWGCTLFYVDSTANDKGPYDPSIFKSVADAFPDVLMMPENESLRYYAYTAPLNSFAHHDVTATPPGAREVYPGAFSVLLASASKDKYDAHHDELVAAVKRGDILLINAWYMGEHTEAVKDIYAEAAQK